MFAATASTLEVHGAHRATRVDATKVLGVGVRSLSLSLSISVTCSERKNGSHGHAAEALMVVSIRLSYGGAKEKLNLWSKCDKISLIS